MQTLRRLREERGISQELLAEQLKITRVSISRYEIGSRTPRPGVLVRIADYFGVKVDDLLREPATKEPIPTAPAKRYRRRRSST